LLKILSSHPHSTILQIVTGTPASSLSHNYSALLNLFDATKKQLYSEEQYQAFLDPDILNFKDMQERKVIRKANLATFISSVFGSVDVGFFHLNEGFLTTIAPDGGRLLKEVAKLFLDLKTQVYFSFNNLIKAYISAMGQPSRDQNAILNDLFPTAQQLTVLFVQRRTPGAVTTTPTQDDLTPAEIEFITKMERRRELLRTIGDSDKQVNELKAMYSWETFLRDLRGYIAKNWEIIVGSRGGRPRRTGKKKVSGGTGFDEAGSFIANAPIQSAQQTSSQPIWEAYEKARMTNVPSGPAGSVMGSSPSGIPPPQSGKTAVTPRPTAEGSQVRRPWTKEEGIPLQYHADLENALFAGLEAVQGPNWAAILQLYGPGGSISEALKDRSQVQLKDKARNLKLFFLKGGHPIPQVLEKVTGRLKGDNTPEDRGRRGKRRRVDDTSNAEPEEAPAYQEGWQQTSTQGPEFPMNGQNVDPALQMAQTS
jgi:protein TBF1